MRTQPHQQMHPLRSPAAPSSSLTMHSKSCKVTSRSGTRAKWQVTSELTNALVNSASTVVLEEGMITPSLCIASIIVPSIICNFAAGQTSAVLRLN